MTTVIASGTSAGIKHETLLRLKGNSCKFRFVLIYRIRYFSKLAMMKYSLLPTVLA
jgi:hypothetical protein